MPERSDNRIYLADTHSHFLPGLDDGSKSSEETLAMLKVAYNEGVTHMVATPHFKINHHNASLETRQKTLENIKNLADENNIPIKLYLGNEVMFFNDLENEFEEKKICTINGTHYLLVEFYPDDEYMKIRRGLETVFEMGLIPVLAHAERYAVLRKSIQNTKLLSDMGVIISINASSVNGQLGFSTKCYVRKLLKKKIVSLISSDSHDATKRAPVFKDCIKFLETLKDEEYVRDVLYRNAFELFELEK